MFATNVQKEVIWLMDFANSVLNSAKSVMKANAFNEKMLYVVSKVKGNIVNDLKITTVLISKIDSICDSNGFNLCKEGYTLI